MKVYVGIPEALIILLVTGILSSKGRSSSYCFQRFMCSRWVFGCFCAQITWVFQPDFLQLSCHAIETNDSRHTSPQSKVAPRSWCVLRSGNPFLQNHFDSWLSCVFFSGNILKFAQILFRNKISVLGSHRIHPYCLLFGHLKGTKAAIIGSLGNKDPTKTLGKHHCEQSKAKKSILASS